MPICLCDAGQLAYRLEVVTGSGSELIDKLCPGPAIHVALLAASSPIIFDSGQGLLRKKSLSISQYVNLCTTSCGDATAAADSRGRGIWLSPRRLVGGGKAMAELARRGYNTRPANSAGRSTLCATCPSAG